MRKVSAVLTWFPHWFRSLNFLLNSREIDHVGDVDVVIKVWKSRLKIALFMEIATCHDVSNTTLCVITSSTVVFSFPNNPYSGQKSVRRSSYRSRPLSTRIATQSAEMAWNSGSFRASCCTVSYSILDEIRQKIRSRRSVGRLEEEERLPWSMRRAQSLCFASRRHLPPCQRILEGTGLFICMKASTSRTTHLPRDQRLASLDGTPLPQRPLFLALHRNSSLTGQLLRATESAVRNNNQRT